MTIFDTFETGVWESGLQSGYALDLNLEYRGSARRLYTLVHEVNRKIELWEHYKMNRFNETNNKDLQKFETDFTTEIKTKSRFIESDAKDVMNKQDYSFLDWISSKLW